jgi:hypothetical protein
MQRRSRLHAGFERSLRVQQRADQKDRRGCEGRPQRVQSTIEAMRGFALPSGRLLLSIRGKHLHARSVS